MSVASPARGMVAIHGAVFLFGISGLFAKFLLLPASVIVLGRTFFAALALGAVLAARQQPLVSRTRTEAVLAALGVVLALHWWSFFYSIHLSSIAVGLLTFSSFPIFVTVLEPLVARTRITLIDLAFSAAVVIGLALVVPSYDLGDQTTIGACWGIFSGATFALLQVLNRRFVATVDAARISFIQCSAAFIFLIALEGATIPALSLLDFVQLAFLGVVCTAVAHTLFISGLRSVRAQVASIVAALEPVYGIVLGALLLGEIPSARTVLGGVIILGTVLVRQRRVE